MMIELIILFLTMVIQVIVPPIPAELVVVGAATQYGILWTTLVAGSGLWLGGYLVFKFGNFITEKFPKLFEKQQVKNISEKIKRHQTFILWIRILPYNPSDIISYAAGLLKFDEKKFIIITCITSYVRCFLLAWLGSLITSFQTALGVAGLLLLCAIGAHILITRK